ETPPGASDRPLRTARSQQRPVNRAAGPNTMFPPSATGSSSLERVAHPVGGSGSVIRLLLCFSCRRLLRFSCTSLLASAAPAGNLLCSGLHGERSAVPAVRSSMKSRKALTLGEG